MAAWRRAIELSLGEADTAKLRSIAQSRTEPASRVERARILLAYREDPSFFAVGRALGCIIKRSSVRRARRAEGPLAALDDRPRPGREPTITPEAKAWLVSLACRKAKELGYPHELWTTRLLARHAREHGPAEGHACLANLAQGTVCKILDQEEVKPHKVRYYLEQRDPDFAEKMAEASGRHEVAWKLYVEHKLKPPVRYYETKRHPNKASALKRAPAIYRNAGWGCVCSLLSERMASASRLRRSTTGASARHRRSKANRTDVARASRRPSKKVPWCHVKNFRQAFERSKCGVAAATFQMAEIGAVHARLLRNGSLG